MNLTVPQIKRLTALANAGLSDAAVAAVMHLDYGVEIRRDAVRYYRRSYGGPGRESFAALVGLAKDNGNFVADWVPPEERR